MSTLSLPQQLTSFIGRTRELSELRQLLADPACQLLTLVGPGGIGKTRLAIELAAQVQDRFRDGAWFVPLQGVRGVDYLPAAIADALHIPLRGSKAPREQLVDRLRAKQLLLVAGNFEHLLEDAALLVEILEAAPGVKILVTSRETLNVREEWVRRVEGMAVPEQAGTDLNRIRPAFAPDEFEAAYARGAGRETDLVAMAAQQDLENRAVALPPGDPGAAPVRGAEPDGLSERELEVLRLVAEGWSNREIAEHLVVTLGTVKKHLNNIFSKLEARSRTEAVARARDLGLFA